jgi:hypothetical protein
MFPLIRAEWNSATQNTRVVHFSVIILREYRCGWSTFRLASGRNSGLILTLSEPACLLTKGCIVRHTALAPVFFGLSGFSVAFGFPLRYT